MPKKLLIVVVAVLILLVGVIFVLEKGTNEKLSENLTNVRDQEASSQSPVDQSLIEFFADSEPTNFPTINTSDWQVYQNDAYGVSFRIPKDWELKSQNNENKALCFGKKGKEYYAEGTSACGVLVGQEVGINDWAGDKGRENYQRWKEAFRVKKYKVMVDNKEALLWKGNGFLITSIPLVGRGIKQEVRLDYNGEHMQEEESAYYGIVQTLSIL